MEEGQGFPASEAGGSSVVFIEDRDDSAGECFRSSRWQLEFIPMLVFPSAEDNVGTEEEEIDPAEALKGRCRWICGVSRFNVY